MGDQNKEKNKVHSFFLFAFLKIPCSNTVLKLKRKYVVKDTSYVTPTCTVGYA